MFRGLIGRAARWLALGAAGVTLVACGGGSSTCVDVYGGTACQGTDPTAQVAKLSLTLSAQTLANSGTATLTATVVATNASNQTMADAPVVLSVDSDATIAVSGSVTGSDGSLTGTVGIGDNSTNRTVTVTASANNGDVVVRKTFQVVGATLTGTPVPAVIEPSQPGEVQFRLVDAGANPMAGVEIVVTGPAGVETVGTTGSQGEYVYAYTSPVTTGTLNIVAQAGGDDVTVPVQVLAAGSGSIPAVNPALTPVRGASVSASPNTVPASTATTSTPSQVRVLFVSDGNAPIANMRVRFDLAGDLSNLGGTFSTGTSLVYSNADGVATTSFVPGTRAGEVTLRACWGYADFAVGSCPNESRTTVTVTADPVSVSIGTNNLIETGASGLTYVKRYSVRVVDSSGVAKPDVQISASVDLLRYIKGHYEVVGDVWAKVAPITSCDNEDLNRNNIAEIYADGHVEDINGSEGLTAGRPALEPRKGDVALSFENGVSRTNASGEVVIRIEYAQDLGSWVEFNILVAASGVSGTEGRDSYNGVLPVPGDAITDVDNPPAFVVSPYGVQDGITTVYEYPAGSGKLYSLCTNPN
jgi:hypothetical protein